MGPGEGALHGQSGRGALCAASGQVAAGQGGEPSLLHERARKRPENAGFEKEHSSLIFPFFRNVLMGISFSFVMN